MSGQVVSITGGLTGIGRAAAVAFAKKGAKVVLAGRREEAGKAFVQELRTLGAEAEFINTDVRKEIDVRVMVDKTVARFGRLDGAVNNAASEGQVGPITDQPDSRRLRRGWDVRHPVGKVHRRNGGDNYQHGECRSRSKSRSRYRSRLQEG
jgi:NAD(P)-dependent dehydrogenase (short-subunit alcohol dehydrogenase family)